MVTILVLGDSTGITRAALRSAIREHLPMAIVGRSTPATSVVSLRDSLPMAIIERSTEQLTKKVNIDYPIRLLRPDDLPNYHDYPTDQYGRPCRVEPLWLSRQRSKKPR